MLWSSIVNYSRSMDVSIATLKDTATTQRSLDKLSKLEYLYGKSIGTSSKATSKVIYIKRTNKVGLLSGFIKQLDKYNDYLKKNYTPYLKDTTSWSRRYIKTLPKTKQKNPPSFTDFYFKGTSPQEAIVILYTFKLGILQEALDIQHKILKE
ncbi:hypothetical protein [Microscilla marina]|nr:hypothetical protein [Microscilla marina]